MRRLPAERRSGDHHEPHGHGRRRSARHVGPRPRRHIVGRTAQPDAAGPRRRPCEADAGDARGLARRRGPAGGRLRAQRGRRAAPTPPSSPGPTLVLRRGEPVEITLENGLSRGDRHPLARHRARQLLRRRARLQRHRAAADADHRRRRPVRRPLHAAARRHVHLPHAPARPSAAVVGPVRRDGGPRARRDASIRPPTTCWCWGAAA